MHGERGWDVLDKALALKLLFDDVDKPQSDSSHLRKVAQLVVRTRPGMAYIFFG